jgi:uncharacterized membrane protein
MIQRIQSLYLLLAAVLMGLLNFAPVYTTETGQAMYTVYLGGLTKKEPQMTDYEVLVPQPGLFAVNLILVALCIFTLFLYKNRKLQKRLSSSLMISSAAFVILLAAASNELMKSVPEYSGEGNLSWGLILPAASIVFLLLANRGINKDEELIRSADRLR